MARNVSPGVYEADHLGHVISATKRKRLWIPAIDGKEIDEPQKTKIEALALAASEIESLPPAPPAG